MKAISLITVVLLIPFLTAQSVTASSVVLNELMPRPSPGSDWIEIYNPSPDSIDLSSWTLVDSTSTMKILTGSIAANDFITFDVTNRLNNSGDSIYLKDPGGNTIDNYSYDSDPGINKSIGRSPNGGTWTILTSSSKGLSNGDPLPPPSPSPTPTPSLTLTPSPSPTHTPTPTKTPSPTATPKKTAIPTNTTTTTPTTTPKSTPIPSSNKTESYSQPKSSKEISYRIASVAAAATISANTATSSAQVSVKDQKQTNPIVWVGLIFVLIGISLMGYIYLKKNAKIHF